MTDPCFLLFDSSLEGISLRGMIISFPRDDDFNDMLISSPWGASLNGVAISSPDEVCMNGE